jgi:hypothetical protein
MTQVYYAIRERYAANGIVWPISVHRWASGYITGCQPFTSSGSDYVRMIDSHANWDINKWAGGGPAPEPTTYDFVVDSVDPRYSFKLRIDGNPGDPAGHTQLICIGNLSTPILHRKISTSTNVVGRPYAIIRSGGPGQYAAWWVNRWLQWPNSNVRATGSTTSSGSTFIEDTAAVWANSQWNGYDLFLADAYIRVPISNTAASTTGNAPRLTFADVSTVPTGRYVVIQSGALYDDSQQPDNLFAWNRSREASYWGHNASDDYAPVASKPLRQYTVGTYPDTATYSTYFEDGTYPSAVAAQIGAGSYDPFTSFDSPPSGVAPERSLNFGVNRSIRGLQMAIEDLAGYFYAPTSVFVNVSTFPDTMNTSTLLNYIGGNWRREYPRTFRYAYGKTCFVPSDDGTSVILPPTDTDPGEWITRFPSSTYAEHDPYGIVYEGAVAFVNGEKARYVGDNFGDPNVRDGLGEVPATAIEVLVTPQPAVKYYSNFYRGTLEPGNEAARTAVMAGTVTSNVGSTVNIGTSLWRGGYYTNVSGTATGGSVTTLFDSVYNGNGFWSPLTGRWAGFIVEVVTSSGYEKAVITASDQTPAKLTFAPAISSTASGRGYRIREPKWERDEFAGRPIRFMSADSTSTITATIGHHDDYTIFITSSIGANMAGWSYSITEMQYGDVYQWAGSWTTLSKPHAQLPTKVTSTGRCMEGDIISVYLFEDMKTLLGKMYKTNIGAQWNAAPNSTTSTPDLNYAEIYGYCNPDGTYNTYAKQIAGAKGAAESYWLTNSTDFSGNPGGSGVYITNGTPRASTRGVFTANPPAPGIAAGATAEAFRAYSYVQYGDPTVDFMKPSISFLANFYIHDNTSTYDVTETSGGSYQHNARYFDNFGDPVINNKYSDSGLTGSDSEIWPKFGSLAIPTITFDNAIPASTSTSSTIIGPATSDIERAYYIDDLQGVATWTFEYP